MDMGDENGGASPAVIDELASHPERFDFFQATLLLLLHCARQAQHVPHGLTPAIGADTAPDQEAVRFRTFPTLAFPTSEVAEVRVSHRPALEPSEMVASVMGLIGPYGVLPTHYTAGVIQEYQAERGGRPSAARDFLDIFQHRALSFFFRAWQKYRLPASAYQHAYAGDRGPNLEMFTLVLKCLAGIGSPALQQRMSVADESLIYYVGHFAHFPRSAVALESVLADYFDLPVEVISFAGQWLLLARRDQSRFALNGNPERANCRLGRTLVVGTRIWSRQTNFRIRVGPLHHRDFQQFLPGRQGLQRMHDLVRLFVGQQLDFDVQLVLLQDEVPAACLGFRTDSRLGWNSWIVAARRTRDADEAIFRLSEDFA